MGGGDQVGHRFGLDLLGRARKVLSRRPVVQQHVAGLVDQRLDHRGVVDVRAHHHGARPPVGLAVRTVDRPGVSNGADREASVFEQGHHRGTEPGGCLALEEGRAGWFGQVGAGGLGDLFSRDFVILVWGSC